ncbi:ceramidase domain-containing protein [Spirosoma sordidisoli]|uniref:Ceramidase n=1 Tax=Spirosoma sordidisoli TaxID=2502893 RepID=A0A4Q2UKJ5_9BACT|nr:ceramidase domain-containing protein [Spirosoma sordidisoli]RYC68000.1 hypothetical protein EQG79_21325 [Spirosoma sordidisoli]
MISPAFSRRLNIATLATLAMLGLWLLLDSTLTATIWDGMTISQSAVQVEYCEFNHPHRVFHQPINTYSNLAYLFFGVFILLVAYQDQQNHGLPVTNRMAGFPLLSGLMGACFVYLCLGSAFFHASLTYVGQRVDMNATYSILLTLVGITIYHVFHKLQLKPTQQRLWVVVLLALIGLWAPLALLVPSSRLVPALILLLNVGMLVNYVQFRVQRSIGLVLLSFVLIVLAIYIRTMDVRKINCDPYSYYQGHALWHVLTALSSFCSYCFFRFDKASNPGRP